MDIISNNTFDEDNKANMKNIVDGINDEINDIISKINGQEVSDISNLYVRLLSKEDSNLSNANKQLTDGIESLFDNGQLIANALNFDSIRKSIQAENYQYDLICKNKIILNPF